MAPRSDAAMRQARALALSALVLATISNCGREPTAPGPVASDPTFANANDTKGPQSTLANVATASGAVAGRPFTTQPSVQFLNPQGKPQPRTEAVTAALENPTGGAVLLGTTSMNAVNGVAAFTNLGVSISGTFTIVFSSGGVQSVRQTIVVAPPPPSTYALTVTRAGNGAGSVTSAPAGIDCGAACSAQFNVGTVVSLTPTSDANSTFAGWSGACTGTGACAVTMDAAKTVSANFVLQRRTLTVTRAGAGAGAVTSTPSGIDCGSVCAAEFDHGTLVTLRATAQAHTTFAGWSGDCSGTAADCTVTMDQARNVTATFDLVNYSLTVTKAGTGDGAVSTLPAGTSFAANTVVTLTATPDGTSSFTGWTGDCTGTGTCTVTMTAAKNVTANFNRETYGLTVTRAGNGTGAVTSSPVGIDCGATCLAQFPTNAQVNLTAAPNAGSTFAGWSGACTGTGACSVTMDVARSVTATFNVITYPVTITLTGSGTGSAKSTPAGIDCPVTCTANFPAGSALILDVVPALGLVASWPSGCSGAPSRITCAINVNGPVNLSFNVSVLFPITVTKAGTGTGVVTSDQPGIDCGAVCSAQFYYDSPVTLTATPTGGSTFAGWSGGGCSGTGSCTVNLYAAAAITATFTAPPSFPLTVIKNGNGNGTVTSSPAGISCGASCVASFVEGTMVTLTAARAGFSQFQGWTNCPSPSGATCVVPMTTVRQVTATFILPAYQLNVIRVGGGGGTVTSNVGGINCGSTCSQQIAAGTQVILTATPIALGSFGSWTGCDVVSASTCTVTITGDRNVVAAFLTPLSASRTNNAGGTLISSPAGINCGNTCATLFPWGTTATVTAAPDPGATFGSWSGCDAVSGPNCTVNLTTAKTINVTFTYPLAVTKSGTGGGTVASSPAGINCGTTCTAPYPAGAVVTLTAVPDANSRFAGWTGACTGTGSCNVTLSAAANVGATFTQVATVNVGITQPGTLFGAVRSEPLDQLPLAINCIGDCTEVYDVGTSVTLRAIANPQGVTDFTAIFNGWTSGPCSGSKAFSCTFTVPSTGVNLSADFIAAHRLRIDFGSVGGGPTVKVATNSSSCAQQCFVENGASLFISPFGEFTCAATCSVLIPRTLFVTMTANETNSIAFTAWNEVSGSACYGSLAPCTVSMNAPHSFMPSFVPGVLVTVSRAGTGLGRVTSNPAGIDCNSDCSDTFAANTNLTLTAAPDFGSAFTGWSYPPCGTSLTCTFNPSTTNPNITATFMPLLGLSVVRQGSGTGIVTSSPAGINCGSTCNTQFPQGTTVTLTAAPATGSTFAGWTGGGCSGTGTCVVQLNVSMQVTATFNLSPAQLGAEGAFDRLKSVVRAGLDP